MSRPARTTLRAKTSRLHRAAAALLAAGLVTTPAFAQTSSHEVDGRWEGALSILGTELAFSVTITTADGAVTGKMDIPSQGALGLDLIEVSYEASRLHFELQGGPGLAVWDGLHDGDTVEGEFTQAGMTGTFRIDRGEASEEVAEEPVPYRQEELSFENGDIHFKGTLTLPEGQGPFPAAVMITGSGPQDRDEMLVGFRPFRVIADHLTRLGVAVYRYDDRGVGGSSGNVATATTSDFADDVLAAVEMLAGHGEIDRDRIGLIGHSEGGVVAPLAATRSEDLAYIVLVAGTSVTGEEIIYEQAALIARAVGASEDDIEDQTRLQRRMFEALRNGEDLERFRADLEAGVREQLEAMTPEDRAAINDVEQFTNLRVNAQISQLETPWFRYFLTYDPADALRQTTIPVLALFGSLDLQVAPAQNRDPMAEALGSNPDVTIEVIEGANHLFQAAETGSPTEYETLEKAFIPGFLEIISDWILARM